MSNKINITQQRVITNKDNTFFTNNKITVGSQIPTNGLYEKGDLIVNIGTNNLKEPMWVCVKSGEPGTWEVVGNGSNSGGSNTRMVSLTNNVTISSPTNVVNIGISFNKSTDSLLVFKNGVNVVENIDFTISDDNTQIVNLQGNWNEESLSDYTFTFIVFKNVYVTSDEELSQPDLSDYQQKTDNNLQTSSKELVGAINEINQKANKEVDLSPYQQKTDNNLQTSSKDVIGAINELFQSANNGKELIANAIGEPLNASDTFSAMSSDINGLLSQFKTNMMNNGVTVESSDKFKSLIDKIATLADNEGKGVQFVQGTSTVVQTLTTYTRVSGDTNGYYYIEIPNLTFEPLFIIAKKNAGAAICFINASLGFYYSYYNTSGKHITLHTYSDGSGVPIAHNTSGDTSIDFTNIKLPVDISTTGTWDWYAIGVGEEDTTLRDSLADILENKGVDVTEEDDMADLITKVDSISSGGLDIISATELPATGRENQLCVITNNPVNNFKITTDITATYDCPDDNIVLYSGENNDGVQLYETTNGAVSLNYYFSKTQQGKNGLYLYKYNNGTWDNLTQGYMPFIENGTLVNTDYFGGIPTGSWKISKGALYLKSPGVRFIFITTANKINFSLFNTVEITARIAGGTNGLSNDALNLSVFYWNSPLNKVDQYTNLLQDIAKLSSDINRNYTFGGENVTNTIDISSWTGEYYFGIYWYTPMEHKCYITNITFR